jgi:hypothetical protein
VPHARRSSYAPRSDHGTLQTSYDLGKPETRVGREKKRHLFEPFEERRVSHALEDFNADAPSMDFPESWP